LNNVDGRIYEEADIDDTLFVDPQWSRNWGGGGGAVANPIGNAFGYAGKIVGVPGGVIAFYGLITYGSDGGETLKYGGIMFGVGLALAGVGDLINLPENRAKRAAEKEGVAERIVEHLRLGVSLDGKKGYAGLQFGL
jgi:hypothetical protein